MSFWSEIRNDFFETDIAENEGDMLANISIDAWLTTNEDEPGEVIARVILSKQGDILVDYHDNLARSDPAAQESIKDAISQLRSYYMENMGFADGFIEDIKKQLTDKESTTSYGEPQAWIALSNGRSIEVTLEQEGLEEKYYFYSVRLHCNETEYENNEFHGTVGVIETYNTSGRSLDEIDEPIRKALMCNKMYPVAKVYLQDRSLSVRAERKSSISNRIKAAASRTAVSHPPLDEKEKKTGFDF